MIVTQWTRINGTGGFHRGVGWQGQRARPRGRIQENKGKIVWEQGVTWNFQGRLSQMFSFFLFGNRSECKKEKTYTDWEKGGSTNKGKRETWRRKTKKRRLMTASNRTSGRNRSQTSLCTGRMTGRGLDVDKWPHVQLCLPLSINGGKYIGIKWNPSICTGTTLCCIINVHTQAAVYILHICVCILSIWFDDRDRFLRIRAENYLEMKKKPFLCERKNEFFSVIIVLYRQFPFPFAINRSSTNMGP